MTTLSVQTVRHPKTPALEYHYMCSPRCKFWNADPEHILVKTKDRSRMTPFLIPKMLVTDFYRPLDRWCKFSLGKTQENSGVMVIGNFETMSAINDKIKRLYTSHFSSFESGFARDVHETAILRCDHILEDIETIAKCIKCHRHDGETLSHSPECAPKMGWSLTECSSQLRRFPGLFILVVLERTIGNPAYPNNDFNIPFGKWQPRISLTDGYESETPIQTGLRELKEEAMLFVSEEQSIDWRKNFDGHLGMSFLPHGRVFNGLLLSPMDDRLKVTIEHEDDPTKATVSVLVRD